MLDTDTKRRIDTARDILVGKLPDPKSQIEQITIALIYKFMDDMDKESVELGGKVKFFTGDFEKYGWSKIFDPRLGGYDIITLYSEAILKMNQNNNIPQLFRDIFKNAYLPYRDPETLKSFLKTINEFQYDHSEKLGDAFEYLLSVMGSQGEAGQFRTPRHIIDFMANVVAPRKDESVLDPACGTAGFLISAYKYILKTNSSDFHDERVGLVKEGEDALKSVINGNGYKGDLLNSDEKKRLIDNFVGYDISPDMVRLSLVNMYLHGFLNPKIYEYDTLSSEEKWQDVYDVIMANPPFMSPKGGIRPHKKFSIQAKRSEVLFVDYIHEHLNPNGRAGIIVPEGIIFQTGTAYKDLRKMLLEDSLYAVISLPAGVFNPYSGVKTSILLLDKNLVKKTKDILFVKINNDGYNLGAQRREIKENDLPVALDIIKKFQKCVREGKECELNKVEQRFAHIVSKDEINDDSILSGDRYRQEQEYSGKWDFVKISEICDLKGGGTPSRFENSYWEGGNIKWISSKHINNEGRIIGNEFITEQGLKNSSTNIAPKNSTIIISRVSVGKIAYADDNYAINQDLTALIRKNEIINDEYLFFIAKKLGEIVERNAHGLGVRGVTRKFISDLQIPLPPLEIQEQIVSEIESYQNIIDGAKKVVENYRPSFKIEEEWETTKLEKVCTIQSGELLEEITKYIGIKAVFHGLAQPFVKINM